eukprot:g2912.t1
MSPTRVTPAGDDAVAHAPPHGPRGCLSKAFLLWLLPVLRTGWGRPLDIDDIPVLGKRFLAAPTLAQAQAAWAAELARHPKKPSLLRVIWCVQRGSLALGMVCSVVQGLCNCVVRPLLLRAVVQRAMDKAESGDAPTHTTLALVIVFAAMVFLEGFLQCQTKQLLSCDAGTRFIAWVPAIINAKAARLSNSHLVASMGGEGKGGGEDGAKGRGRGKGKGKGKGKGRGGGAGVAGGPSPNALIGNDVVRTYENWKWACLLLMCVAGMTGGIGVLLYVMGRAALCGLGVMAAVMFINWRLSGSTKAAEARALRHADDRLGVLLEVISSIKAVKLLGWEAPYLAEIHARRAAESRAIRRFRLVQTQTLSLGRAAPVLATCASVAFIALRGGALSPPDVFATISAFQALRMPTIMISFSLVQIANILLSLERIRRFLLLPERGRRALLGGGAGESDALRMEAAEFVWPEGGGAAVDGAEARAQARAEVQAPLKTDAFTLRIDRLQVRAGGSMVAVIGAVGSGKSSLLAAVLGDMQLTRRGGGGGAAHVGTVASAPTVAYVPQRAWVASGTVAENVLFGHPAGAGSARFQAALRDSAFDRDVALLPDGVRTEVGERGTTLSGGQAQRLAIARALFHCAAREGGEGGEGGDRDEGERGCSGHNRLLLLDDPLAAVDARVAKQIFERLRARCRPREAGGSGVSCLMALNQLQFLPHFDHIVLLDGGRVLEEGGYEELMQRRGSFSKLVALHEGSGGSCVDDALAHGGAAAGGGGDDECGAGAGTGSAAGGAGAGAGPDDAVAESGAGGSATDAGSAPGGGGRLVQAELRQRGRVASKVVLDFICAMRVYPLVVLLAAAAYGDMAFCDVHLSRWMMDFDEIGDAENQRRALVWMVACACQLFLIYSVSVGSAFGTVRAGRRLHHDTVSHLLKAPMRWFESTPSGRIMSRFSGDLSLIDYMFSNIIDDTTHFGMILLAVTGIIVWILPSLLPVLLAGLAVYGWLVVCADRSNRECKRMVNNALSPLLTHVTEVHAGRTLVATMGLASYFEARYMAAVDAYNRYNYVSSSLEQWTVLATNSISFVASTATCAFVLYDSGGRSPVLAGLAVTYSFLLPYFLAMLSMMIGYAFKAATSLERICEYRGAALPQEPAWQLPADAGLVGTRAGAGVAPAAAWPSAGRVVFQGVSLRYRSGLELAVRDASFVVDGGARVGVVGRTGAGKSSLLVALFRLVELDAGCIEIDGQRIDQVGLQLLRRSIAIIPQAPLLIRGTVRRNLDPFGQRADAELEGALARVGLPRSLLHKPVGEGAAGLSAGEAQLLSLARTLLRRHAVRLLVMDEPTSNIDMVTDEMIQRVVREAFAHCTAITIAHRLGTVIDSDKILVMAAGRVAEYGTPHALLQRGGGALAGMLDAMGHDAADKLRQRAREAAEK